MPLLSEPSEEAQQIANLFRWFRGGTVSAFSQIEFSMCRLLACFRKKQEFSDGLERLPYNAEVRSQTFRSVFEKHAKLAPFASEACEICDAFDAIITLRSYMAHGFARIDMSQRVVQMRKFRPEKGNEWNEDQWDIAFEKLEPWATQIDALSQAAVNLCIRVSKAFDLGF